MTQVSAAQPPSPKTLFGHPVGLYLLFLTEMWERFSYYGMRGLLTLFMTKAVMAGGMGYDKGTGSLIYGWFTGLVYLTPIIGGWLADKYIGQRRAILIGGLTMMLGQFSLGFGGNAETTVYLGLLMLIIGNGFFKPNISTLVGALYPQGDHRRDSAYTIFYMGINLGAFLAPLVCGYFAEDMFAVKNAAGEIMSYGFRYGFIAAGVGMGLGQLMFNMLSQSYLGDIGKAPSSKLEQKNADEQEAPLTKEETDRLRVIFIVVAFVTFFWAGFEQAGSSLTLYTDEFINRTVGSFTIPTSWFQSVNPLFILLCGPIFSALWLSLAKSGKDLSIPIKMGLGMILLGIGFFMMIGAVYERAHIANLPPTDPTIPAIIKANIWWLIGTYFFHTIGELCLSPIGLSMITKLSPVKLTSLLYGVWFLSPFVAQIAGGYIAKYVEELGAYTIFMSIAAFVIVFGFILWSISGILVRWMHGRG